jgi:hypothetical protein
VKIKTRPEHADMLEVNDWLAELQDVESVEPTGPGNAKPSNPGNAPPTGPGPSGPGYAVPTSYAVPAGSPGHAVSASYVRALPTGAGYAVPVSSGHAGAAVGSARPEAIARPGAAAAAPARTASPAAPGGAAARAVIGDQLRMPVMWCEMGSCVSWHADPAALGEADARARATGAGWRIDAFGRLACPRCQQTHPGYWTARQVVPWDRSKAIDTTAPIRVAPRNGAAGRAALRTSRDPGRAARGYSPPSRAELEWHHDFPADEAMPAGRYAENPVGTSRSRGLVFSAVRAWRARGGRPAALAKPVSAASI